MLNCKAIAFDAYGTLFDVASINAHLESVLGAKTDAVSAVWRSKQLEYTWLRSLMERYLPFSEVTKDALHYALAAEEVSLESVAVTRLLEAYNLIQAYAETRNVLSQLQPLYHLAVLSNGDHPMLERNLNHNGLQPYFKAILSADDVQTFKPKPAVYQMALDQFNLAAEEILFVSSNTWDVAGAKSFGLQVAWLNRGQKQLEQLGLVPDMEVDSLKDLLTRLRS